MFNTLSFSFLFSKGNKDIVLELLSTMAKARDVAFVDKVCDCSNNWNDFYQQLFVTTLVFFSQSTTEFKKMVNLLIFTIKTRSPELAFHAAVSLGRLCVVEPVSKTYLISRLPDLTSSDKGEVRPCFLSHPWLFPYLESFLCHADSTCTLLRFQFLSILSFANRGIVGCVWEQRRHTIGGKMWSLTSCVHLSIRIQGAE